MCDCFADVPNEGEFNYCGVSPPTSYAYKVKESASGDVTYNPGGNSGQSYDEGHEDSHGSGSGSSDEGPKKKARNTQFYLRSN